ncbi:MAG: hypothetical protein M3433_08775 [Actinomycetota bacterium]|nr:hypothetical protein [Actinomycetota bacterium]
MNLGLVAAFATAFTGCGEDETAYCVDRNDEVVENQACGDEHSGGDNSHYWVYGAAAVGGATAIRRGTKLSGGSKILSTNKSAITSRGGFGSSGGSTSGVGRPSGSSSSSSGS